MVGDLHPVEHGVGVFGGVEIGGCDQLGDVLRQPGDLLGLGFHRRVILKHGAVVLDGRTAAGCGDHQRIQRRAVVGREYRVDHLGGCGFSLFSLAHMVGQRAAA